MKNELVPKIGQQIICIKSDHITDINDGISKGKTYTIHDITTPEDNRNGWAHGTKSCVFLFEPKWSIIIDNGTIVSYNLSELCEYFNAKGLLRNDTINSILYG